MIILNGEQLEGAAGKTVTEILAENGFQDKMLAVEINGSIVTRRSWPETKLSDGDKVEVVRFVGGG